MLNMLCTIKMFTNFIKGLFVLVVIMTRTYLDNMFSYDKIPERPTNYKIY